MHNVGIRCVTGGELDLSIDNSLEAMSAVKAEVDAFCQAHHIVAPIRRRLLVVVDELLNNSINYGCRHLGNQAVIRLQLVQANGHLDLEVRDNGTPPFNPLESPPPELGEDAESRQIGGLGIHLVRGLSSRFGYSYEDGWNVVRIAIDLSENRLS